jgi:hypothetical protein
MTKCFEDSIECTELLLHIILSNPDLNVTEAKTQYGIKNLQGRSVRLDIHALDSIGKKYNIEVERGDKGDKIKKVRYNSSLMDANSILPGDDVGMLPETYVIMITEEDFLGKGKPLYAIQKYVDDTGMEYDDGSHVIYVNGEYKDDPSSITPLGKLIHDFNCIDPADMNYPTLAERARFFKEDEKGLGKMCKVVEELIIEERTETALSLLESSNLSLEEIAKHSRLSVDEVRKLASEVSA